MRLMKTGFPALVLAAAAVYGSAGAVPALADSACRAAPGAATLSEAAVRDKVAGLGYEVWRVQRDDGCYEIEARDAKGAYVELNLDPVSGELIGWERED